ncbi:MAG TPA: tetratricopeptide repeat protein [Candidatus Aminicenantes bacterium]|nr:tetratricopeptide repeat protein [Candidatus Aminicenantes bacterium]
MKRKNWFLLAIIFLASCATFQKTYIPPSFYLEGPPPLQLSQLTLNERIAFEEGWKNLKRGNIDGARKEFLKLGEKNAFFHLGEGYCRLYEKDMGAAEAFFLKALELNPELVSARIGLANIYEQQKEEDKLFIQLREILKKEPENSWAKPKYEDLKSQKTQALIKEAQSLLSLNKKEEAKQSLLKALFYSPNSIEAHLQLARLYRGEKKYPQALNHYQTLSQLSPKDKQILKEYAETLLENDDLSQSLDLYEKLNELSPGDKQVQEKITYLKNQLGIVEIPSRYNDIPKFQSLTREDLAAILGVKFNAYLPGPTSPPIIVDISTSWATRFILKVTAANLMDIYDNHTFEPTRVVTRAELAETFFRLINYLKGKGKKLIPQIPENKIQISDIPEENLYYLPAVEMIAYQLMELYPQKKFMPDRPVSGAEALSLADLLVNLIK